LRARRPVDRQASGSPPWFYASRASCPATTAGVAGGIEDTFERLTTGEERATSLDVTVRAHVFGRPSGAWVYDRILERVTGDSRVWVATRSQIADHLLDSSS
jgi:hypothetical protein